MIFLTNWNEDKDQNLGVNAQFIEYIDKGVVSINKKYSFELFFNYDKEMSLEIISCYYDVSKLDLE